MSFQFRGNMTTRKPAGVGFGKEIRGFWRGRNGTTSLEISVFQDSSYEIRTIALYLRRSGLRENRGQLRRF